MRSAFAFGRCLCLTCVSVGLVQAFFLQAQDLSRPGLAIDALTTDSFEISWPAWGIDYALESTLDLTEPARWTAATEAVRAAGDRYVTRVAATDVVRFFRLRSLIPPDPGSVAPELTQGASSDLWSTTSFLYLGATPIQTGVTNGTIQPVRAAVLRGRVRMRDGLGLSGVRVTILNHPEFGQTLTREDGKFDLAVNGGAALTVKYEKQGFCPIQRQTQADRQDYTVLPEVVMVAGDPIATLITLGIDSPLQVARGSIQADTNGVRQATLLFPSGTCADLVINGAAQACQALHFRMTEFTVGTTGPAAMPAMLPPTSAYTYCMEINADEAAPSGGDIVINQPLCFYVENFLKIPVGMEVPVGGYDRARGVWVASRNARVIKILSVTAGKADVDSNGDGKIDSMDLLAGLGITDEERAQLAKLYRPEQSLWRSQLGGIAPRTPERSAAFQRAALPRPGQGVANVAWDLNLPLGKAPDNLSISIRPAGEFFCDCDCPKAGMSVLFPVNQVFGEDIPLVGVPFDLHYRSDRVIGRGASATLDIPLTGNTPLAAGLKRVELNVQVAGQSLSLTFPPLPPNQSYPFTWDGRDGYGRFIGGSQPVRIIVTYVYPGTYSATAASEFAFALVGGADLSVAHTLSEKALIQQFSARVSAYDARGWGLGAWTPSVHHYYDPNGRVLHYGFGDRRSLQGGNAQVIETFAGNGGRCQGNVDFVCNEGGTATQVPMRPTDLAFGPDGSLYFVDGGGFRVRRIAPNGIVTTVAGTGRDCAAPFFSCATNEGPALQLDIRPSDIAVGADGSLFVAEEGNRQIRQLGPDGILRTIAGNREDCLPFTAICGEGQAAATVPLAPKGLAVGPDGSLHFIDRYTVRRIGLDGRVYTVAGGGAAFQDGIPATQAQLAQPWNVTFGTDGSLYIASEGRVSRVTSDGTIRAVAGTGRVYTAGQPSGDGGPATEARLTEYCHVDVGPDGVLFIAESGPGVARIRRVGIDGIITTVAGEGSLCPSGQPPCGDGGPAAQASFFADVRDVALGPDGALYVSDMGGNRIRRIAPGLEGFTGSNILIPSEDANEVYEFDKNGRHLKTIHPLTGATLLTFQYDSSGRLIRIVDADNNTTTIERDVEGNPTGLVGPYGQRTILALDGNGYLSRVTNPANETWHFAYNSDGLLAKITDPNNHITSASYDSLGRFAAETDAMDGTTTVTRTNTVQGRITSSISAEGRATHYRVERDAIDARRSILTFPDGTQSVETETTQGSTTNLTAEGMSTLLVEGPDPRFGMLAPFLDEFVVQTPSGLTATSTIDSRVTLTNADDVFSVSNLIETLTVNGQAFSRSYSGAARTFTNSSAMGRRSTLTIDVAGRPVSAAADGLLPVTMSYDALGRMTNFTQGSGADARTTLFEYNATGDLSHVIDSLGRLEQFGYDASSRLTNQTLPDGRAIQYAYDAKGNLVSLTPPSRPAHRFSLTPTDLVSEYLPPDAAEADSRTRYTYNRDRELTKITRPDGLAVEFNYSDGGTCNCGKLSSIVQPRGRTDFNYDSGTGHLTSVASPDGIVLNYAYDGVLLTNVTYTGAVSAAVSYTYDSDFRLASVGVNGSNFVRYEYDLDGLLTNVGGLNLVRDARNGLLLRTELGVVTTSYEYNGFGEVTRFIAAANGKTIASFQYDRDGSGRLTRKTESMEGVTDTYSYAYDQVDQLTNVIKNGVVTASYSYDGNGNRLTGPGLAAELAYDVQDRLLQAGDANFSYTPGGDLKQKVERGDIQTFNYDLLGNLVQVSLPAGRRIDYLIDGRDRRVGRRSNGVLDRSFVYQDLLRPLAEFGAGGGLVSRFVYAEENSSPAYLVRNGSTYQIVADHLGSPRMIVDTASGAIVQRINYDEFGIVLQDTNPGFQPFGFAGGIYDSETRLLHFGARDYDPSLGRWLAKDPLLFAAEDTNLYAYSGNDPINHLDPTGSLKLKNLRANSPVTAQDVRRTRAWLTQTEGEIATIKDLLANNKKVKGCRSAEAALRKELANLESYRRNLSQTYKDELASIASDKSEKNLYRFRRGRGK